VRGGKAGYSLLAGGMPEGQGGGREVTEYINNDQNHGRGEEFI